MTPINKIHIARWDAAKKLFGRLIRMSKLSGSEIYYEGIKINSDDITMTDTEIYVKIGTTTYSIFINDILYDEGLYTRISDFANLVKAKFKLVKHVKW